MRELQHGSPVPVAQSKQRLFLFLVSHDNQEFSVLPLSGPDRTLVAEWEGFIAEVRMTWGVRSRVDTYGG